MENKNFQSLRYNVLDTTEDIVLENSCDNPDSNYFNIAIKNFETPYVIPEEFFKDHLSDTLSFLHVNLRRISKNFENFKLFLSSLGFTFNLLCLFKTCLHETRSSNKSLYELPNYTSTHQVRKKRRREESQGRSTNLESLKCEMIGA